MTGWGAATYGEPCRECGFSWTIDLDGARAVIAQTPAVYAERCQGSTGDERLPGLSWPVVAYVCHVADNFAIFAERLVGIVRSGRATVTPYDEDELADARHYEATSLGGALWSLERHAGDLLDALAFADAAHAAMYHPDRGDQDVLAVAQSVAHDAFHHTWDLERLVAGSR